MEKNLDKILLEKNHGKNSRKLFWTRTLKNILKNKLRAKSQKQNPGETTFREKVPGKKSLKISKKTPGKNSTETPS